MKKTIWGLLLLVPSLAAAQRSQDSWDKLRQLAPGEDVRIVLKDAKSYGAKFERADDKAITVRLVTGEQTFSRENVLRVSTKGRSRRQRNALIGAGVGVGLGFVAVAAGNRNDPEARAIGYLLAPPVFGGIGAAVGAIMPTGRRHDVYRAR